MLVKLIDGVLKGLLTKDGTWEPVAFHDIHFNPEEGVEYIVNGVVPISTVAGPLVMGTDPEKPWEVTVLFDNKEKGSWEQVAVMGKVIAVDATQQKLLPSREDTEIINRTSPYRLSCRRMTPLDLSSLSAEEIQIAWQENKKMDMAHSINSYLKDRGINSLTEEQIQDIFTRLPVMSLLNPEGPVTTLPRSTTKGEVVSALRRKADTTTRISVAFDRVCFALEIRQDQTLEEINHEVSKRFPATIAFLKLIMNDISRILEGQEMSIERLESVLEQLKSLVEIVDPRSVNIKE